MTLSNDSLMHPDPPPGRPPHQPLPPQWKHPTADSWFATVGGAVQLEVYQTDDEDPERYAWWTVDFATGRAINSGESIGLDNAMNTALASLPGYKA